MLDGIESTFSGIQIAREQELVEPIEVFERFRRQADLISHLSTRRAAVSLLRSPAIALDAGTYPPVFCARSALAIPRARKSSWDLRKSIVRETASMTNAE